MKKILITGGNGYIGSNLVEFFDSVYNVHSLDLTSSKKAKFYPADIVSYTKVWDVLSSVRPDIVIHTAGVSSLAGCEKNPDEAYKVNVNGTRNIIKAINSVDKNIKLLFMSSDYVFSGEEGNYKEKDKSSPKTVYGMHKIKSEGDIMSSLKSFIIVRSANVYGRGGNFFNFLVNNLQKNITDGYFCDTFYTPTYIDYLTSSIQELVQNDYKGVIHIAGKERLSRYSFALKVAQALGKSSKLLKKSNQPKSGSIAKDSSLDSSYSRTVLTNHFPTIEQSLYYLFRK